MVFWNIGSSNATSSSSTNAPAAPRPTSALPVETNNALPAEHPVIPLGSASQCPVDHTTRSKYLSAAPSQSPFQSTSPSSASTETAQPPPQFSRLNRPSLSQEREVSSIPRAAKSPDQKLGSSEGAGDDSNPNWVYPSEQQFYNAMARKKHNPQERDMKSVVPIHNAVNERAWEQILMWEVGMGSERCGGPRLISFAGKPTERTPKAWVNVAMGYTAPFDRHDWIVDRCGKQVRYVIDFYTGRSDPGNPRNMAFYLDVRPALDNYDGIETRVKGWMRQYFGSNS